MRLQRANTGHLERSGAALELKGAGLSETRLRLPTQRKRARLFAVLAIAHWNRPSTAFDPHISLPAGNSVAAGGGTGHGRGTGNIRMESRADINGRLPEHKTIWLTEPWHINRGGTLPRRVHGAAIE